MITTQGYQQRLRQQGLRGLLTEPEMLLSRKTVAELLQQQLREPHNRQRLQHNIEAIYAGQRTLHDLSIAAVSETEPYLARLAADIAFMQSSMPQPGERRLDLKQQIERLLTGADIDPATQICEAYNSTRWLLLLGEGLEFGPKFRYETIQTLLYSGPSRFKTVFERQAGAWQALGFQLTITPCEQLSLISIHHPQPTAGAWRFLLDYLLNQLVITGRPLSSYNATFYMPLDLLSGSEINTHADSLSQHMNDKVKAHHYKTNSVEEIQPQQSHSGKAKAQRDQLIAEHEAWIYFSPHQRRYLFDQDKEQKHILGRERIKPIKEYRLFNGDDEYEWALQLAEDDASHNVINELRYPLKQVTLYRYFNDMMMLALNVSISPDNNAEDWSNTLLTSANDAPALARLYANQYHNLLKFTKNARVLYPSFIDAKKEGKHFPKLLYKNGQRVKYEANLASQCATKQRFKALLQRLNKSAQRVKAGASSDQHTEDSQANLETQIATEQRFKASLLLSRPILSLLQAFFTPQNQNFEDFINQRLTHLPDDRMFVSVAYGLSGNLPENQQETQRAFSYALYVDDDSMFFSHLDDYCYSRQFIEQQMDREIYKRWQDTGTWAGFSEHCNAYMGANRFFDESIAERHIPYIYNRMLLSALFYQLSLNFYNRRITEQTNRLIKPIYFGRIERRLRRYRLGRKGLEFCKRALLSVGKLWQFISPPFGKLREDFILFTNQYWFKELTSQVQGKEQFKMQLAPLELEEKFSQIKDEMQIANDFVSARQAVFWTTVAAIIAITQLLEKGSIVEQISNQLGSSLWLWLIPSLLLIEPLRFLCSNAIKQFMKQRQNRSSQHKK